MLRELDASCHAHNLQHLTSSQYESFTNGWSNPYRYDGADRVRYDVETGLYWMSTRAYDPTLGRFLARDPLGRTPMIWVTQPYVYGGNNPLSNVDPTGRRYYAPMGGDPNYDPVHNVTSVPDSHVLAVHKNGATVGQGKKLAPASPFDEGNVADTYEWGNAENYVIGKRFWGNALDAIIQAAQMMLHEKQSNTGGTFLRNSALKLFSLLVAGAIGGVLGFMAAGATGAAIGGGGGAAASFIAGAWVDYMTNVEIEQLQKTIADLQAVQSGGYQVWYLFGSYHGAYSAHSQILGSDDFEYGLGDSPSAVLLKVGEILEQDCADGSVKAIQWGNSPGLTPSQDTSYTPPPECGI